MKGLNGGAVLCALGAAAWAMLAGCATVAPVDFNVRGFGAKGDGAAKDTAAIQRADA